MIQSENGEKLEEFSPRRSGLFQRHGTRFHRIAEPILVSRNVYMEATREWAIVAKLRTLNRKFVHLILKRGILENPQALRTQLANAGYALPENPQDRAALVRYLRTARPASTRYLVDRSGWHRDGVFLLPEGPIGHARRKFSLIPSRDTDSLRLGGSFKGWQNTVGRAARRSPVLQTVIALSLAAPLLRPLGSESVGFHLFGRSTIGKSTCLLAANSVARKSTRETLLNWDVTYIAGEDLAYAHSDTLLPMDEIGRLVTDSNWQTARRIQNATFQMTSESGRTRSKRSDYNDKRGWRLVLLSSGEKSLSEIVAASKQSRLEGEQVRLIDLPADVGEGHGIFRAPRPRGRSSAALAESVARGCAKHHGHLLRAFLNEIVEDQDKSIAEITALVRHGEKLSAPDDPVKQRIFRGFVLAYAAGIFAIRRGLLTWSEDEFAASIWWCIDAAVAAAGGQRAALDAAVTKLRDKIGHYAPERSELNHRPYVLRKSGRPMMIFKHDAEHGRYVGVRRDLIKKWLPDGIAVETLIDLLGDQGHLIRDPSGKATRQIQLGNTPGRLRYVCIRERFWRASRRHPIGVHGKALNPVSDVTRHQASNIDIFCYAKQLIDQYGDEAPKHATMRADALGEKGELDGYAVWLRIIRAIDELLRMTPKDDERLQ